MEKISQDKLWLIDLHRQPQRWSSQKRTNRPKTFEYPSSSLLCFVGRVQLENGKVFWGFINN